MYINSSAKIEGINGAFVTEKAPRTGICAAMNGTLIIIEVSVRSNTTHIYHCIRLMVKKIRRKD